MGIYSASGRFNENHLNNLLEKNLLQICVQRKKVLQNQLILTGIKDLAP
jgi:hypothetical protein